MPQKTPRRASEFSDMLVEVLQIWLLDELVFVLLPLGVIFVVRRLTGQPMGDLLLLPEWSFASIVLLASGLSRFVELKTEYQRDRSYRVYAGVRLTALLLVTAVLILALAVARPYGLKVDERSLGKIQLVLVITSALWVGMGILVREHLRWQEYYLPGGLRPRVVRRAIWRRVTDLENSCSYLARAVDAAALVEINPDDPLSKPIVDERLHEALRRVQVTINELHKRTSTLVVSSPSRD